MAFLDLSAMKVTKTVKTGAVPIHAVIDSKGQFAYQSAFLGNVIKKIDLAKQEVVGTFFVNSRPGHLGLSPDDKTLLVLNKYSTGLYEDFKASVGDKGVINPTNIQLVDTATGNTLGQKPVSGEPFSIVIAPQGVIKDASLSAGKDAVAKGRPVDIPAKTKLKLTYGPAKRHKPGVFDAPGGSEVYLNAFSHQFAPNEINVFKGDTVKIVLQNIDEKGNLIDNMDVVHGFTINGYAEQSHVLLPRGVAATLEFKPEKSGTFDFYCSNWCGAVHMEMRGTFIVE
jgi:nitrous-oxide reductase